MVVGEFTQDADVVVIGGGPAGYSCAFRAAELGRQVTVIDAQTVLGGSCLHDACIPTKTLLHAIATDPDMSADDIASKIERARRRLAAGLSGSARSRNIDVIEGTARFLSNRDLQVAGEQVVRLRFKRAVICVGSGSKETIPRESARTIMTPSELVAAPARASKATLVIGNDGNALEAATIAARMGGEARLYTLGKPLLSGVPKSLVDCLRLHCGFDIDDTVASLPVFIDGHWTIPTSDEDAWQADLLIDADAPQPHHDALDVSVAGVQTDAEGWIQVDQQGVTTERRILAAGDCTGGSWTAGAAMAQGRVAAEVIAGQPAAFDPSVIPTVVWTNPNLVWCGGSDGVSDADSEEIVVPWAMSGLAVATGRESGQTLLRWEKSSGLITGAGAVGADAAELADGLTTAIELGATLQDLADIVCAHPTRSELLYEAARQAIARA